jgi:hypothetical protein
MSTTIRPEKESRPPQNGKPSANARRTTSRRTPRQGHSPAAESVDPTQWDSWSKYLAGRKSPAALSRAVPGGRTSPLLWALPEGLEESRSPAFVERLDRWTRGKGALDKQLAAALEPWLADAGQRAAEPGYALECLAWTHVLPRLAAVLTAAPWWQLIEHLIDTARQSPGIVLEEQPLAQQLLAGELPLTLAFLFPEVDGCRELADAGREAISLGASELLDSEGLPHCRWLPIMRPLLACWTRIGYMQQGLTTGSLRDTTQGQYTWLLRQALRMTRHDGTQVLSHGTAGASCKPLLDAALALADDLPSEAIAQRVLRGYKSPRPRKADAAVPTAPVHSEWSETAVLRADWSRGGPQLAVTFDGREVQTELNCRGETIWSGVWQAQVVVNGQPLAPVSEWQEACWQTDEDVDYLELEVDLEHGWRIERQILLARTDGFALMSDVLLGGQHSRIEYRGRLPLAGGMVLHPAEETREGFLVGRRRLASVLPLALPEWRAERTFDSVEVVDDALELTQTGEGRCLYAPLFIDLNEPRTRKPLTWRRLTVAQQLQIEPSDAAVGFRVHAGNQQWLIYRSLAARGNRTVLGQNLISEFVVARFGRNGKIDEMIEIE